MPLINFLKRFKEIQSDLIFSTYYAMKLFLEVSNSVLWKCIFLQKSIRDALVDSRGGGGGGYGIFEKKNFLPPKLRSFYIGLLRNFMKNIPDPYRFHSPPRINWCVPNISTKKNMHCIQASLCKI